LQTIGLTFNLHNQKNHLFEKESFGALHQMLSSLYDSEKESVWDEIESELQKFESDNAFTGPCEMVVAVGEKP
jgi:hypothetical protein